MDELLSLKISSVKFKQGKSLSCISSGYCPQSIGRTSQMHFWQLVDARMSLMQVWISSMEFRWLQSFIASGEGLFEIFRRIKTYAQFQTRTGEARWWSSRAWAPWGRPSWAGRRPRRRWRGGWRRSSWWWWNEGPLQIRSLYSCVPIHFYQWSHA